MAVAFNVGYAAADGQKVGVFGVTISNLTSGQPFTPPVLATHDESTGIFEVGEAASLGIQEIAENGNNGPLLASLMADGDVFDFTSGSLPPLVPASDPGETGFPSSGSYVITGSKAARFLSVATMLICTNDGFTGLDSLELPKEVGDTVTAFTMGYDAGTEINTEDFADMVPPCPPLTGVVTMDAGTGMTDPALAEGGVIMHHPGIDGVGVGGLSDLTLGLHDWTDPVAKIEVTRHANIRVADSEVEIEAEFEIELSGDEEVPSVVTAATGEAEVQLEIEDGEVELEVELKVCDIEDVVAAHIHGPAGPPGTNAGIMLGLFAGGPFSADDCEELVDREWDEDELEAGLTLPLEDFVASLLTGNAYINVHTLANPGGEIRGQLVPDEIEAEFELPLVGHQEVPRVLTAAAGEAEVELEFEDGDLVFEFELEVCDIEGVTQAHIHAPAGLGVEAAPVLFLFGPSFGSPFTADDCEELSEGEFTRAELEAALFGISLEDFVAALVSGNAYINVHTVAHPGGEIRGQIG